MYSFLIKALLKFRIKAMVRVDSHTEKTIRGRFYSFLPDIGNRTGENTFLGNLTHFYYLITHTKLTLSSCRASASTRLLIGKRPYSGRSCRSRLKRDLQSSLAYFIPFSPAYLFLSPALDKLE